MTFLSGKKPENIGVQNGRLAACPKRPNCVSSQGRGKQFIDPFRFESEPEAAWQILSKVMGNHQGAHITELTDQYMHTECRTPLLGFVDDVEFYLDAQKKIIHLRSASRLGYSDLGKNRQRIEQIRQSFKA